MHLSPGVACDADVADLPVNFVTPVGSSCNTAGTWRWEFTPIAERRGSDERSYRFELRRDEALEVFGTLAATGTQLTISDEGGRVFLPAAVLPRPIRVETAG